MAHRSRFELAQVDGALLGSALAAIFLMPAASWAVDWGKVTATDIPLFYPGQVSWEKALTASEHKGATKFRAGETCRDCHADEEADMGASRAEMDKFAGRSSLVVQLKAAVAGGNLHLQVSGPAVGDKAPDVGVMLGSEALKSTTQAGCWVACHDDAPGMASDSGQKLGKYLARSRSKNTPTGGGDSVRPQAELDAALAAGEFLELLEVDASGKGERVYILDKLHERELAGTTMRVEGGRWIAEMQRPLAAGGKGEIALDAGKTYHVGVAIHDPGVKGRKHLVSLERSLVVGSGSADIVVQQQ